MGIEKTGEGVSPIEPTSDSSRVRRRKPGELVNIDPKRNDPFKAPDDTVELSEEARQTNSEGNVSEQGDE